MTSDETVFSMMTVRFPSLFTFLHRGIYSELMQGIKMQSYHYLSNDNHRRFIFNSDGTYEYEELVEKIKNDKFIVNYTEGIGG
jgi:hypothetical protein